MNRIRGIDSIRFICALVVAFGHVIPAAIRHLPVMRYGLGLLINGPAAVIVFFVISGFCIHFPFRKMGAPDLKQFYARRLIRITLPMIAGIFLAFAFRYDYWQELIQSQHDRNSPSVLWSLIAEIIYYLLYPLLLRLRHQFGWTKIIIVAFVLAFLTIMTNPTAGNYPSFGHALNWVVGLPVWLLGCLLAETVAQDMPEYSSVWKLWFWRTAVIFAPLGAVMLRTHFPISIGFPWTLNLFAILVYFWLAVEFRWFSRHEPWTPLEIAGRWSYSLYLMHRPVMTGLQELHRYVPFLNESLFFAFTFCAMMLICFVFYLLIEKPSQNLAVWVSARIKEVESRKGHGLLREPVSDFRNTN